MGDNYNQLEMLIDMSTRVISIFKSFWYVTLFLFFHLFHMLLWHIRGKKNQIKSLCRGLKINKLSFSHFHIAIEQLYNNLGVNDGGQTA